MADSRGFARHQAHGIGWFEPGPNTITFFDSPASEPLVLSVEPADISPCELENQQRVWWFDGVRWRIGRVISPESDGQHYLIALPNGDYEVCRSENLRVRWDRPISDVLALLKTHSIETRFFHTARTDFLHNVTAQRAACQTLGGPLSSGVELHAHQLEAASRVLHDPIRRYLLADEVGLGKTIEAGMIARQLLIEQPGAVLVVAPASLTDQWRRELENKFRLGSIGGHVEVVSFEEVHDIGIEERRLTIIDEAHRLASQFGANSTAAATYEFILDLSRRSEALLLLSATPVRSNEDGFLKLLHLLDPVVYPLNELDAFRRRVEMRDALAGLMSELNPDLPTAFLGDGVRRAMEMLSDDRVVVELGTAFDDATQSGEDDLAANCVRRIRFHLVETYRIHRRMVRTRRTKQLLETFPVRGRETQEDWLLVDRDERRSLLPALVDEIRFALQTEQVETALGVLRSVLGRMSGPIEYLVELGHALTGETPEVLEPGELEQLGDVVGSRLGVEVGRLIVQLEFQPTETTRIDAITGWVHTKVGRTQVAVACSSTSIAERIAGALRERLGDHRVAEITANMAEEVRDEQASKFVDNQEGRCTALVIDRTAEEGLNLQTAMEVLHVDLVVSSSRIEQRLGRFDRWSNKSYDPVVSMAFREVDDELDNELGGWRTLLHDSFQIFDRSSATLQYVLPTFEDRYLERVLQDGLVLAGHELDAIREEVERQRRLITNQDILDSLEGEADDLLLIDNIGAIDSQPGEIEKSIRAYAVDALHFNIRGLGSPGGRQASKPLVPSSRARKIVGSSLATTAKQTSYTVRRTEAIREGKPLLRFGEPLIDRLLDYALSDDRGRAFIVEANVSGASADLLPMFLFLFDFNVSPDAAAPRQLEPTKRRTAESLAERFLPARFERVLRLEGVENAAEADLKMFLDLASTNLASRPERLDELLRGIDWQEMCERHHASACAIVSERLERAGTVVKAIERLDRSETREAAIRARRQSLGFGEEHVSQDLAIAVRTAIGSPSIELDSCGVIILTSDRYE